MNAIRHIVVATDFSECSRTAVDWARELAQSLHASLEILHVWEITPLLAVGIEYSAADLVNAIMEAAESQLADELARVKKDFPSATSELRTGITWEGIVHAAKEKGADLIVIGTHGRKGFKRFLLGSVADKVVRSSTIPVVTVCQPKATQ